MLTFTIMCPIKREYDKVSRWKKTTNFTTSETMKQPNFIFERKKTTTKLKFTILGVGKEGEISFNHFSPSLWERSEKRSKKKCQYWFKLIEIFNHHCKETIWRRMAREIKENIKGKSHSLVMLETLSWEQLRKSEAIKNFN
jgi:hypothetical protein